MMLNEFIEKIVVHEADKSTGDRIQRIDIHFNFIGQFELPQVEEKTPEQIAKEEKALPQGTENENKTSCVCVVYELNKKPLKKQHSEKRKEKKQHERIKAKNP